MKSKLIICDLDGTLIDTKDINYRAYKEALSHFAYDLDYDFFCEYCNGRHYMDFIPKLVDDKTIYAAIHTIKKSAYRKYLHYARVNEPLIHMLRHFSAEYHLAIVTTASKENCFEILDHCGLRDDFDVILTREDVAEVKPNPEGFLKAMAYFGIDKNNTIVFEDSTVGEEAARKADLACFIVKGYN